MGQEASNDARRHLIGAKIIKSPGTGERRRIPGSDAMQGEAWSGRWAGGDPGGRAGGSSWGVELGG